VLFLLACAATGSAQEAASERDRDLVLRREWSEACSRILEGHPWDEVASDLEAALTAAGKTPSSDTIEGYLNSIRLAAAQADSVPDDLSQASPSELVAALLTSRVVGPANPDWGLVTRPLHMHRQADGSREVHWVEIAEVPAHRLTDPAVRVFQRGRKMIPALLAVLDDPTATRAGFITPSTQMLPILFRRSDLAMALLEAIARCRFYITERWDIFSERDNATREKAIELARTWWQQTKSMPDLEARSWLMERISYEQAHPMIEVLALEGHSEIAIRHLRQYLFPEGGKFNIDAARRLCRLGDSSALDYIVSRGRDESLLQPEEIKLLIDFGGRREFALLADLVAKDKPVNNRTKNKVSREILLAMEETDNRLAIPVFAEALDVEDKVADVTPQPNRRGVPLVSRAELAAKHIQRLTGRDFRFNDRASVTSRKKAIQRVREWWREEGRGLYGFEARRLRRTGGIR
jgi:hypothetical protein